MVKTPALPKVRVCEFPITSMWSIPVRDKQVGGGGDVELDVPGETVILANTVLDASHILIIYEEQFVTSVPTTKIDCALAELEIAIKAISDEISRSFLK